MKETPILEMRNLTVAFGDRKVVDGLTLSLSKGETLGIVGESGSGKSISCLSIMGLLPDSARVLEGSIGFDGREILGMKESEIRKIRGGRISLVFQEPFSALNPSMRCGEQILESVDLHLSLSPSEARGHILNLLNRVGIEDAQRVYAAYPHQLSGGQLQRVLIAMAVCCGPDIIIADEPTTALDVTVQHSVLQLFREIQTEYNSALIFVSHDLGVIREIADRVLVMQEGRLVESGPVDEVFERPRRPYTQGLLLCRPPIKQRWDRLPTVNDFLDGRGSRGIQTITSSEHDQRLRHLQQQRPLIHAEEVTVRYPQKRNFFGKVVQWTEAVRSSSFDIYPGETLGLVGESGSGKSSLGKAILRLNEYAQGRVFYRDVDVFSLSGKKLRELRKKIQIVFQDPYSTLNPKMKIGQAIQEVLYVHAVGGQSQKERKNHAISLLERCGMKSEHYDRYPHEFSGGQRQRISIARALAVSPEFIVCDESVSALDVSVQAQVLNLLKDLQNDLGLSYLFISHDLSVVRHMSDRILVMKQGCIVEQGTPYSIFESPQDEYTRQLINAIPGKL